MITRKDKKKYLNNPEYNMALEKYISNWYYANKNGENGTVEYVYNVSNELLDRAFQTYGNLEGKRVLTVGSSGDQLLNAVFYGAEDVTLIDANLQAKNWIEYKIAMIKNFDFRTFCKYMKPNGYFDDGSVFDMNVYQKIFKDLSPEVQVFWGVILLEEDYSFDIVEKMFNTQYRFSSKYYHDEESYNKLKEKLEHVNINYITAELTDFPKSVQGKFDLILLSNIAEFYITSIYRVFKFRKVVEKLFKKNLNAGGKIQVCYDFNNGDTPDIARIFNSKNVSKTCLNQDDCTEKHRYNYVWAKEADVQESENVID